MARSPRIIARLKYWPVSESESQKAVYVCLSSSLLRGSISNFVCFHYIFLPSKYKKRRRKIVSSGIFPTNYIYSLPCIFVCYFLQSISSAIRVSTTKIYFCNDKNIILLIEFSDANVIFPKTLFFLASLMMINILLILIVYMYMNV